MALSQVAQALAKLSEADLKVKLAELKTLMPDVAAGVEAELKDNSERIAKERQLNEKRNKVSLDQAAFQPLVAVLGKVKLEGLKVDVDVVSMTLNADGSIGDITVKMTGSSLSTVQTGVSSRIGQVLTGKAPGRTLKVKSEAGAWSLIEEPTKTASTGKKSTGEGAGSRGNKRLTLNGKDFTTGTAAAKELNLGEVGKGSAWVFVFASKNGDALKAAGAKFYGQRDANIEKLITEHVKAGNLTIVNEDGSEVQ